MSVSSEQLYIEGAVIHQEGYSAGYSGRVQVGDGPYPMDIWMGEVWHDGFREGELERLSLSEPSLFSTMQQA